MPVPRYLTSRWLLGDQRALAIGGLAERRVRRHLADQLVVVPLALGLLGLLDLVDVHRMALAAVGIDRALAEQRVVGRHLLHLVDHRLAVLRALERGARLQGVRARR